MKKENGLMNFTIEEGIMRIPTKEGIIRVQPATDSNNPGVYIDLEREDGTMDSIAVVECNNDEGLQTIVWSDIKYDADYYKKIQHKVFPLESESE